MPGFNHFSDCDCGWCRSHGFARASDVEVRRDIPTFNSITVPNARCPVCDASVYFFVSPDGGRVYFDALGPPWPKHPCTDRRNGRDAEVIATSSGTDLSEDRAEWLPLRVDGSSARLRAARRHLAPGWKEWNPRRIDRGTRLPLLIDTVPQLPDGHLVYLSEWTERRSATVSFLWPDREELIVRELRVWDADRYGDLPMSEVTGREHLARPQRLRSALTEILSAVPDDRRTPLVGPAVSPEEITTRLCEAYESAYCPGWQEQIDAAHRMRDEIEGVLRQLGFFLSPSWADDIHLRVHAFG